MFKTLEKMPDNALLVAYAQGNVRAARVIADRYAPRAFRQALRMLADRSAAEDIAQEAMLRLWRIAPDWQPGKAQVSTWLYRVVANLCTDALRKRRPSEALDSMPEPPSDAPSAVEQMLTQARFDALTQALADLPDRQAQAVALRHLEGLGNPEIAAIMELSVEAVESLVLRAKRKLAQVLHARKAELGVEDD